MSDTSGQTDQGRGYSRQIPQSGHWVTSRAPARPTRFDKVRRGYDCTQVDAHLDEVGGYLEQIEAHVDELATAAAADRERAGLAEEHLRTALIELQIQRTAAAGEGSFGARAQRTLRLAERQADEIRAQAVEEAATTLAQVRVAAQAAFDELRRGLLARVDAEGRLLDAALTEHGRRVAASMAAPRPRSVEAAREGEAEGGDASPAAQLRQATTPPTSPLTSPPSAGDTDELQRPRRRLPGRPGNA